MMSKVIDGAFKLGLSGAGQAVLQITVTAYLARLLEPRDFGVVAAALIVTDLLVGFSQVGMGPSLVQKKEINDVQIRTAFTVCWLLGVVGTLAVALLAVPIANFLRSPDSVLAIRVLSLGFILNNIGIVADSLAARELRFELLAIRRMVGYVVGYPIIGVLSGLAGAGSMALVFANLGQIATTSVMMLVSSPHAKRPLIDSKAFKSMWAFGLGFSVARLANTFAAKVDQFVVARSFNLATLGLYTRAHAIMRFPINTLGQIVEDVAFPSMAAIQDDKDKISSSYLRTLAFANCVMFPAAFFVALAAPQIVNVLLGEKWERAGPILAVLAFTLPLRSTQRLGSAVLRALGHSWLVAGAQFVYLFAVLIGAYVGAQYGVVGSAAGVSLAVLVQFLTLSIFLLKITPVGLVDFLRVHLRAVPSILLTIIITAATIKSCQSAGFNSLYTLFISATATTFCFLLTFFFAGRWFFGSFSFDIIMILRSKILSSKLMWKRRI